MPSQRNLVLFLTPLLTILLNISLSAQTTPPAAVIEDWKSQDGLTTGTSYLVAINKIARELNPAGNPLQTSAQQLQQSNTPPNDPQWINLYLQACQLRRQARLQTHFDKFRNLVFTKHYDMGGTHYAYTEGQSDAQSERHFIPGSSLCLLKMDNLFGQVQTLLSDPAGVIRDPDISYDAQRILFAWKKSLNKDDYHLYELNLPDQKIRQLTTGLGFADYEGAYLPNGDIIFNSTRCVQTVDCWWTEVSNLYTCDKDGRFLRRLGFDQVHTNYPTVTPDGRIIYTRWDYNDRGQLFPQGLFQMNPDGTNQSAFYGNNSWFPTTILHARMIPGTQKVLSLFTGHHTLQKGKLGILDPAKGREENAGARLIAPIQPTQAVHVDAYGQKGDQFQYPYPLSQSEFLVTFKPDQSKSPFAIYWMDHDGRRELLASDPEISCNQPIPLASRPVPHIRPSMVDYRKDTGTYYIQDIYQGPGLAGIPRGAIKRLRVVALDFRAAGIGNNGNSGPAGGALVSTPISINNGSWDPKIVLGDATIYPDGSAFFQAPARTPLYFQAIDEKGHVAQTMRSWSTLMPGENASCVGCHEDKNSTALARSQPTLALQTGAQSLAPFYGPPRGFSFPAEIQPILNKNCISCHNDRNQKLALDKSSTTRPLINGNPSVFSLLQTPNPDTKAKRNWSDAYLALTSSGKSNSLVNWVGVQSIPSMLPPYFAGAAKSSLLTMLEKGHQGTHLSREDLDKIACWIDLQIPYCADYTESNLWTPDELRKYNHFLAKRKRMQDTERQNIQDYLSTHNQ